MKRYREPNHLPNFDHNYTELSSKIYLQKLSILT